jgi:hypothetical protein
MIAPMQAAAGPSITVYYREEWAHGLPPDAQNPGASRQFGGGQAKHWKDYDIFTGP